MSSNENAKKIEVLKQILALKLATVKYSAYIENEAKAHLESIIDAYPQNTIDDLELLIQLVDSCIEYAKLQQNQHFFKFFEKFLSDIGRLEDSLKRHSCVMEEHSDYLNRHTNALSQ